MMGEKYNAFKIISSVLRDILDHFAEVRNPGGQGSKHSPSLQCSLRGPGANLQILSLDAQA